jgi:hypothetical protein
MIMNAEEGTTLVWRTTELKVGDEMTIKITEDSAPGPQEFHETAVPMQKDQADIVKKVRMDES